MSKTKRSSTVGSFLRSIFHRSHSKLNDGSSSKHSKKKRKEENNKPVDFGIAETEKLKHFQRAKPPANRRRPKSSHPASQKKSSSKASVNNNQDEGLAIKEEPPRPPQQQQQELLSRALADSFRQRCQSNAEMAIKVQERDGGGYSRYLTPEAEEKRKTFSQSVPDLSQPSAAAAAAEEEASSRPVSKGSSKRSFWHLLKSGGSSSSKSSRQSSVNEEEQVQIRPKGRKVVRSESLAQKKNFSSYKELIQATHKSTPPLEMVN